MSVILGNGIAILLVAALVGLCLREIWTSHKKGGCGGCSGGCSGSCAGCAHSTGRNTGGNHDDPALKAAMKAAKAARRPRLIGRK